MKWKSHGGSGRPVYRCTRIPGVEACGRVVISARPLEELVGALLADALDTEALLAFGPQADGHVADLERLRERWAQLDVDHAMGLVSRDGYVRAVEALRAEVERLESQVARERRKVLIDDLEPGESIALAWRRRPAGWRNRLARLLIDRIEVHPVRTRGSNRFDPDRVRIRWVP
jgi:hypothetical protein